LKKPAVIILVLFASMLFASSAQAFVWSHVGGDPLVPGGVWNRGDFGYLMLNSSKVRTALGYVRSANGQPSWVLPSAYNNVAKGKVHTGLVAPGTHLGAMSYGRTTVRVVRNTIYAGQYNPLPIYYIVAKKTATVKIAGKYYQQTTSYWVSMAKPCGNVFIFHKRVVRKRLWELRVEKRLNSEEGARLTGWTIDGHAKGKDVNVVTSSETSTLVGRYLSGTRFDLSEVLQDGWEIVSPVGGSFAGRMPRRNLTLTFVNRRVEEERYRLYVEKREDSLTGPRLAGWQVTGLADGEGVNLVTSGNELTLVGIFTEGTAYDLSEVLQGGWEIVSPAGGEFTGTMPAHDVILTFVNRQAPPPPQHVLRIFGSYTPLEHLDRETFSATLDAVILEHSDNDPVTYRWVVNGVSHNTDLASYYIVLSYETVYNVTLVATDADGHQAQFTLPAFNEIGPSDPPPPPPN